MMAALRVAHGSDERDEVLLADVDVDAQVETLLKQQKAHDWAHPKHASTLEAEMRHRLVKQAKGAGPGAANLKAVSQQSAVIKASFVKPLARTVTKVTSSKQPAEGADAQAATVAAGGGVVVLQGELHVSLCKSSSVFHSAVTWDKFWCILCGSTLYLYTTPHQRHPIGVVALSPESRVRLIQADAQPARLPAPPCRRTRLFTRWFTPPAQTYWSPHFHTACSHRLFTALEDVAQARRRLRPRVPPQARRRPCPRQQVQLAPTLCTRRHAARDDALGRRARPAASRAARLRALARTALASAASLRDGLGGLDRQPSRDLRRRGDELAKGDCTECAREHARP
jgi:hypothetical protein